MSIKKELVALPSKLHCSDGSVLLIQKMDHEQKTEFIRLAEHRLSKYYSLHPAKWRNLLAALD